jgi:hypothetical protein
VKTIYLPNMIFLFLSSEQSVVCLSACVRLLNLQTQLVWSIRYIKLSVLSNSKYIVFSVNHGSRTKTPNSFGVLMKVQDTLKFYKLQ